VSHIFTMLRKRIISSGGLTLVEIIVSIIILSLTMFGLTNIFISGKRYILHARARMAGGELGKHFLDPLQMDVREDTWDTAENRLRAPSSYTGQSRINNIDYTANYTVSDFGAAGPQLRRVVVNLIWNETSP